ncbi:MAG: hypothetical protein DMD68_00830 [Gemmatimonadetes bacterium]|nr:MAG: hypothetical protein AUI36_38075 [Cyanobacteria bacterium 13_1_40CM_2_61_4]PYO86221.1 MAG: hypothetical protein DMD68_00830 [Gemmatimonadota bacterium]
MTQLRTFVLIAVLALPPAAALRAQGNRWERQVREQLQRSAATLQNARAGPAQLTHTGPLNAEESASFIVTLQAGVSYQIVGVCDNDCTSLGLTLATMSNNDIAADRSSENFPVLQVTPQTTMAYRVKVVMAACRMSPCWYGVGVYRR